MRTQSEIVRVLTELQQQAFRRRFVLHGKELQYLQEKGLEVVLEHGRQFALKRLAPAFPEKDGKQTPYRNHPIFIAQHATATCCRSCLSKWHHIEKGRELTVEDIEYIVLVWRVWITKSENS